MIILFAAIHYYTIYIQSKDKNYVICFDKKNDFFQLIAKKLFVCV